MEELYLYLPFTLVMVKLRLSDGTITYIPLTILQRTTKSLLRPMD